MNSRRFAGVLAVLGTVSGCGVSEQQETQIGQQNAEQISAQLPLVQDPVVVGYLDSLGRAIASRTSRANLEWHFALVDSPDINAFALPGGYVYVNRGLVERMDKMDQLAGVVGHEIGHVVERHSVKQMEKAQGANVGVALLCTLTRVCDNAIGQAGVRVAGAAWFARHSRKDEAQADSEAVVNTIRAGIDPHGIPEMFQILLRERRNHPTRVEGWFASHPLEESRVTATNAQIRALDATALARLSQDDQSFRTFKERVIALPPSPTPKQQLLQVDSTTADSSRP